MLTKGSTPTFLDHAFANAVLRVLNGVILAKVAPAGAGKFVVTEGGITLDLSAMATAQQAAQIAALQKIVTTQQGQIDAINRALRNATITCANGNVVLVLRGLP